MEDDERFQELKEKEIIRLTTPLTYVKEKWHKPPSVYDCEGNIIEGDCGKYILEPNPEILSHDEILMYAPRSKEASRVRLRQGKGTLSDKYKLYGGQALLSTGIPFMFCWVAIFSFWLLLLLIIIPIIIIIYIFFIHDFKDKNLNKTSKYNVDEQKFSNNNNELSMLFESKEKIARKMIERKFPAPQMTNTKFNAVIDECKKEVESQVSILNALTPTTKTKHEIASRKKLIKQLISKIDDLTNELILFEENNIEDIIDSMDELINSVKNYK